MYEIYDSNTGEVLGKDNGSKNAQGGLVVQWLVWFLNYNRGGGNSIRYRREGKEE